MFAEIPKLSDPAEVPLRTFIVTSHDCEAEKTISAHSFGYDGTHAVATFLISNKVVALFKDPYSIIELFENT